MEIIKDVDELDAILDSLSYYRSQINLFFNPEPEYDRSPRTMGDQFYFGGLDIPEEECLDVYDGNEYK